MDWKSAMRRSEQAERQHDRTGRLTRMGGPSFLSVGLRISRSDWGRIGSIVGGPLLVCILAGVLAFPLPSAGAAGQGDEAGDARTDPIAEGAAPESEATDRVGLEEIMVRARRREEPLEETPVSITALGPALLEEAQVRQLDQIQDLVPNMVWTTGYSGVGGNIVMRGVGKGAEDLVFDPGVGVYVDGILLSRDIGQLLPMLDIQQIEALRGPQGTLFGKNTVGGAISIHTQRPGPDYDGRLMFGYGNYNDLRTQAMVNVPIIEDKLFARVNWVSEQNDGYARNLVNGASASDRGLHAFMASLRAQPIEGLTIDVAGSWSRDHQHAKAGNCAPIGPSVAGQFVELFGLGFTMDELLEQCALSGDVTGPYQFLSDVHSISDVESYGVWGTIAYEFDHSGFTRNIVLKSITGWRRQLPRLRDDVEATNLAVIQRSTLLGPPTYFGSIQQETNQQQITQEFQLGNDWWGERIHSMTGVYLFWDQGAQYQELISLGGTYLSPNPLLLRGLTPSYQETSIDNFDVAVYHQSTWDIWDFLSVTAGFRWTQEEKRTGLVIDRFTSPPVAGTGSNLWNQLTTADSQTFSEWTPMASILWKVDPDWIAPAGFGELNAYFSYSAGFKGGGFSAVQGGTADALIPFKPETVDAFEIGLKSTAWDGRVRANLSLFYMDYDDIQVATTQPGNTFTVERVVENAAQATSKGFELEIQALPIDGLFLSGSVGYLNARYDSYLNSANNLPRPAGNAPPPTIDRSGHRFTGVPVWQTNLTGQYEIPVGESGLLAGSVTPRLEWIFESDIQYGGFELPSLRQPSVHRLNARLTWLFNLERTSFAIWCKNFTDAEYFRSAIAGTAPTYGIAVRYFEAPRTFGFELAHDF
jgi:iron complex outermembrane receptor protein